MGIYTAASKLAYVVKGSKLDTSLDLAPGTYKVVVEEWNNCGSVASQVLTITVIKGEVQVASPANNATVPLRGVSNLGLLQGRGSCGDSFRSIQTGLPGQRIQAGYQSEFEPGDLQHRRPEMG